MRDSDYTLNEWLSMQLYLEVHSFKTDPRQLRGDDMAEYVRWNVLALEDELHEALQEVGWKPWATSRYFNRDEYIGELVDALHFLGNLFLVAGVDGNEVFERYRDKVMKNEKRQEDGYDGVRGKCPACHREAKEVNAV